MTALDSAQRRTWRDHIYGCTDLTPAERLVLLGLSEFADWKSGANARPGVAHLAAMCGLKSRIVERALARGRELNLIEQEARANPRRGLAAVYRLVPVPDSTRTTVRIDEDSTRTTVRLETEFNPHETEVQPARNGVSTRTTVQPTKSLTPSQLQQKESTSAHPREPATNNERGHRLPEDWEPPAHIRKQLTAKHPGVDLDAALEEFRNYWCDLPGARGRKRNWVGTFRNRIAALDKRHPNGSTNRGNRLSTADQRVIAIQALKTPTTTLLELE